MDGVQLQLMAVLLLLAAIVLTGRQDSIVKLQAAWLIWIILMENTYQRVWQYSLSRDGRKKHGRPI